MKKLSWGSAGFGAIGVLVAVVVVGLIGGIGYYAYQKNKDNKPETSSKTPSATTQPKQQPETTGQPSDETANWKTYTKYGITFKYPADWRLQASGNTQSTSTYLTSPDFANDGTKGERITVDETQFAQSGLTADNFKSNHLDANPNPYTDYKVLTVNGKKAVQYYQGDSRTTVFFLANGKTVTFVLDTFPNRAIASAAYAKVLETVTLN